MIWVALIFIISALVAGGVFLAESTRVRFYALLVTLLAGFFLAIDKLAPPH